MTCFVTLFRDDVRVGINHFIYVIGLCASYTVITMCKVTMGDEGSKGSVIQPSPWGSEGLKGTVIHPLPWGSEGSKWSVIQPLPSGMIQPLP